ncbi:signal peptidase I [Mitsuaria sp. WAJ17]|uniref:signal peptidase I n=1 Tax=Mitsuaria sp. WAJ17 TaxID=2761452 RepID=UPI001603E283|nr:signal peptidase I [Mitsuaria sp. WAJ17]MBB2487410.1 signal peptidase I [Mitsuaria sp. WAJ17]
MKKPVMQWLRENRGFLIFLLCFGFFRTAIADWNPIPTGSMRPNLLEGDVVLVNRVAYDFKLPLSQIVLARLGDPQRGDIITFSSPKDGTRLIKRVVAVGGDQVEMRDERLYINGEAAAYENETPVREPIAGIGDWPARRVQERVGGQTRLVQWLDGVHARSSFEPLTVPPGQLLVLGDNRDNSTDSRYIGLVPREAVIGRAHHILASADIDGFWTPRFDRFGMVLR